MKKLNLLLTASIITCAISCTADPLEKAETDPGFVFTANLQPESKVILGEDGQTPYWESDDKITVFPSPEGQEPVKGVVFTANLKGKQKALTADFTCPQNQLPQNFNPPYIAVYGQLSADAVRKGEIIEGITIPATQAAIPGTYEKESAPVIAKSETTELYFNNIASVLKFKVDAHCVTTVSFKAGNVAGKFNEKPVKLSPEETGNTSDEVTLRGNFEPNKNYFMAILPGNHDHFSVAVNGRTVKTYDKPGQSISFAQNMVTDLGVFSPEVVLVGGTTTLQQTFAFTETEDYYLIPQMKIPPFGVATDRTGYPFKVRSGERTFGSKFVLNRWADLNEDRPGTTYKPMECTEPVEALYDVYLKKNLSQIFFVKAGGPGPDEKPDENEVAIHIYTKGTYLFDKGQNPTIHIWIEGDNVDAAQEFTLTGKNLKDDVIQPYRHWVLSETESGLKRKDLGRRIQVSFFSLDHPNQRDMYLLDQRMFFEPDDIYKESNFIKKEVPSAFPIKPSDPENK